MANFKKIHQVDENILTIVNIDAIKYIIVRDLTIILVFGKDNIITMECENALEIDRTLNLISK